MLTSAVGLAAAVSVQVFVGEEVLFLCAVTLLVMAVAYALTDRALLRRALPGFAAGVLLAAGLALLVLAYPLWFQFAGPLGVADGMFSPHYFSADLRGWWTLSPLSVAGSDDAARLTTGPAEYNTFLGWPLLVVVAGCAAWLGRRPLVIACVAGALTMGALSLGPPWWSAATAPASPARTPCSPACRWWTARCRCGSRWPCCRWPRRCWCSPWTGRWACPGGPAGWCRRWSASRCCRSSRRRCPPRSARRCRSS
ncbi:hypothetical protein [Micromonospora olivasterospora]|uniref:hypothetical protein n=1 Tax=Micromonospora olivasterospora TaxID=1880 RepID=UPI001FE2DAE6|nr:hypothetical protein [Micromonospora olivasterospora]